MEIRQLLEDDLDNFEFYETLINNSFGSLSFQEYLESESASVAINTGAMDNTVVTKTSTFGRSMVYHVCSDVFHQCKNIKNKPDRFKKVIGDDSALSDIRDYAKTNPKKSIILHDESSGGYTVLKLGADKPW